MPERLLQGHSGRLRQRRSLYPTLGDPARQEQSSILEGWRRVDQTAGRPGSGGPHMIGYDRLAEDTCVVGRAVRVSGG